VPTHGYRVTFTIYREGDIWRMDLGPITLRYKTIEEYIELFSKSQGKIKLPWEEEERREEGIEDLYEFDPNIIESLSSRPIVI